MTKPLAVSVVGNPEDRPVTRMLFRAAFFGAVLLVGATVLSYVGYGVDQRFMSLFHR